MTIRVRDYEVRLTRNKEERRQVRNLRYDVFVLEEGASVTEEQKALREEYDSFDLYANYMAVFHNGKVVGTYRIIDREAAEKAKGFYTETEYNISKIKKIDGNILEMSRACVAKDYRDNALVMRLLWLGLGEYIAKHEVKILFGVASWVGRDTTESAHALSYLYYNHLSPYNLRARVLSENFAEGVNHELSQMNILPKAFVNEEIAKKQMPPLIKGYLRLGASFGKGVFIDKPFNTYDVFVMIQTNKIEKQYQKHFVGSENAFDHLTIDDNVVTSISKLVLLPLTGSFAVLKKIAKLILKEDAKDAEFIEENDDKQSL